MAQRRHPAVIWPGLIRAFALGVGVTLAAVAPGKVMILATRQAAADPERDLPPGLDLEAAELLARHLGIGVRIQTVLPDDPASAVNHLELEPGPVLNRARWDPDDRYALLRDDGFYAVLESVTAADGTVSHAILHPDPPLLEDPSSLVRSLYFLRHKYFPDPDGIRALRVLLARELTEDQIRKALGLAAPKAADPGAGGAAPPDGRNGAAKVLDRMIRRGEADLPGELGRTYSPLAVAGFSGLVEALHNVRAQSAALYRRQRKALAVLAASPAGGASKAALKELDLLEKVLRNLAQWEGTVHLPAMQYHCMKLVRNLSGGLRGLGGHPALRLKLKVELNQAMEMVRLQRSLSLAWDREALDLPWRAWRRTPGEKAPDPVADLLIGWKPLAGLPWPLFLEVLEEQPGPGDPPYPSHPSIAKARFVEAGERELRTAPHTGFDLPWVELAPATGKAASEDLPKAGPDDTAGAKNAERKRRIREREARAHERNLQRAAEKELKRQQGLCAVVAPEPGPVPNTVPNAPPCPERPEEAPSEAPTPPPPPTPPRDLPPSPARASAAPPADSPTPAPEPTEVPFGPLQVRHELFLQRPRPTSGFAARVYDWLAAGTSRTGAHLLPP